MLFASNVDVVARAFVTHMIHFIHGVFTYISHTNHPFAWPNIPFRSMDPYGIQAINPFILKGFVEPQKGGEK